MTNSEQGRPRRRRATIREQWAAHGTYPPPERQFRRAGMIFGGLITAVLLALVIRIVVHVLLAVWHWSAWS